jgi:hypothetical protein
VALLPKPGGQDTGPKGHYPVIYRFWAKARCSHLKAWQQHGPPSTHTNNMQGGRRTADAAWMAQVRQALQGVEPPTIEFLSELRKCYEHVQGDLVLQAARAQGYPTNLLRVSLGSYRWTRLIGMGTIVGRGVVADRGIIAGSSHATFEIAMLIQRRLAAVALASQMLAPIHIDDPCVTVSRPTKVQTARATKAAASDCKAMFDGMGLPLADDKAQWIASSPAMHDIARRILGKRPLPVGRPGERGTSSPQETGSSLRRSSQAPQTTGQPREGCPEQGRADWSHPGCPLRGGMSDTRQKHPHTAPSNDTQHPWC